MPTANGAPSIAYDSLRHESVLVYWDGAVNSVFTWDGAAWTSHGTVGWSGATSGMAYDPVRDRLVLLTATNDVWEWDRSVWSSGGPTPMTAWTSRPLIWDASQQRVLSMDAQGLWRWDGATWSLVAGSAPPPQGSQFQGVSLARDDARNVLVATYVLAPYTLEWNGASWQAWLSSAEGLRIVYAPSLGRVVGYRDGSGYQYQDMSDTLGWDPATHQWDYLAVGGSPGVHDDIAITYDTQSGSLVLFANGIAFSGLWQYDLAATYVPRTWTVGSVGWLPTFHEALLYASNTDRIVVPSGTISGVGLHEGLRIECGPGVVGGNLFASLPVGQSLSLTGGSWEAVFVPSADEVHMHGCTVACTTATIAHFTHVTNCVFGPPSAGCSTSPTVALDVAGPAVIDSCVVTGQAGWQSYPWQTTPSTPALQADGAAPIWIVHCTLAGGSSATAGTAAPVTTGGSVTVVGASILIGSGTPSASMRLTADTTWNGAPPPASLTIPSLSWLSSAVTAPVGGTLSLTATLQPLDTVFLFFDTRMQFLASPGFALPLQLDPSTALLAGVLTQAASSYSLLVPGQPSLQGLATQWQGLAVGAQLALTNARTILLQ